MSTPAELRRGLQGHPPLQSNEGMLFLMPGQEPASFWMKNVTFPIDIVFIRADARVDHIAPEVPPCPAHPCPLYRSKGPVRYVLETPAGWAAHNALQPDHRLDIDIEAQRVSVAPPDSAFPSELP